MMGSIVSFDGPFETLVMMIIIEISMFLLLQ